MASISSRYDSRYTSKPAFSRPNSDSFFKNLLGFLKLKRFYRKTRTNILILHHKEIINLNYILFFTVLTILSTLSFYFIWTVILFPRTNFDQKLVGFEHYPKNLLPVDMFERRHYHISSVVCENNYQRVVGLVGAIINLKAFATEEEGKKKALHFHIFTSDTTFENTTMALDELLYPEIPTEHNLKISNANSNLPKNKISIPNPSNIKFHMHNSIYNDCNLMLVMSPILIMEKTKNFVTSNSNKNKHKKNNIETANEIGNFDRLLAVPSSSFQYFKSKSENYKINYDSDGQKQLLHYYEKAENEIFKIYLKQESNPATQQDPNTNSHQHFAYIFDPHLSENLPDTASLDKLINSKWRSGTDVLLETLFRNKISIRQI